LTPQPCCVILSHMPRNRNRNRNKDRQTNKQFMEQSTFDSSLHHKSKKGFGYGLKKGAAHDSSGMEIARVFGWDVETILKNARRIDSVE
jgi:DNA mismatch repair ATPase MutS